MAAPISISGAQRRSSTATTRPSWPAELAECALVVRPLIASALPVRPLIASALVDSAGGLWAKAGVATSMARAPAFDITVTIFCVMKAPLDDTRFRWHARPTYGFAVAEQDCSITEPIARAKARVVDQQR